MLAYVIRRLIQAVATLVVTSIVVFLALHLGTDDPARLIAGDLASTAELQIIRERYGLDRPLILQYIHWADRVLHGDLGESTRSRLPVAPQLLTAFRVSLVLSIGALAVATILGVPLGVLSATHRDSTADTAVMAFAVAGMSLPGFWIALLLVLFFSLRLGWLPTSGWGTIQQGLLPVFSLSLSTLALLARITRGSVVESLLEDFIRTARAKGLPRVSILYKHALRNALPPVVTVMGLRFGLLVGGAAIHETIFAIPGAGRMIVQAVRLRDFPVVQAGVLVIAVYVTALSLVVDVLYSLLDPRIRYE